MSQGLLPALARLHQGPRIFLEAVVAAHMPQFALVLGLKSFEEFNLLRRAPDGGCGFPQVPSPPGKVGPSPPMNIIPRCS